MQLSFKSVFVTSARDSGRIGAAEADGTKAVTPICDLQKVFHAEITQRIHTDDHIGLHGMLGGEKRIGLLARKLTVAASMLESGLAKQTNSNTQRLFGLLLQRRVSVFIPSWTAKGRIHITLHQTSDRHRWGTASNFSRTTFPFCRQGRGSSAYRGKPRAPYG